MANEDSNLVTVIDVDRGAVVTEIPVGVEPEGMGISPDGKYLVNTSETTNMAHLIDTAKREVVGNILVDSRPRRAEWTADGAQFWVSAEIGGTVSVVDAAKREVVKRITFTVPGVPAEAIQPVGIAITRDRKLAFVALGPANRVAVIDAQSYEVTLPAGRATRMEPRFQPGPEPGLHDERGQQRHLRDRCRIAEGPQIRSGRPGSVGGGVPPVRRQ